MSAIRQYLPGKTRFPIISHHNYTLSGETRQRLETIAHTLLKSEPTLKETSVFGEQVDSGCGQDCALLINNSYDIPLLETNAISGLEYRISLLAEAGDLLLLRGQRERSFEQYREQYLRLGALNVVHLPDSLPGATPDFKSDSSQFHVLLERVRATIQPGGCLTLVPFIGMGSIWVLAASLSVAAGISVRVAAPPPRLTRRVNDKLWFADRVKQVLGEQAIPPTRYAYGAAALTALMRNYARKYKKVIVKVPDSAGSAGNIKFDSATILGQPATTTRNTLLDELRARGWRNRFPLMVEVWDSEVLSSPSVQIWIPKPDHGDPIIEGIFDQLVSSDNQSFVGASVARLAPCWEHRLVNESALLASLMQRLGYYGRISFDTVLAGQDLSCAQLHWIECNGRWGGVSIPMTLMNRLCGDYYNKTIRIVQNQQQSGEKLDFADTLRVLKNLTFVRGRDQAGLLFPIPGAAEPGSVTHYIAMGESRDQVDKLIKEADLQIRHLETRPL